MTIRVGSGGGGGIPINGVLPLNIEGNLETLADDTVWLKTGVVETDLATYPDATVITNDLIFDSPGIPMIVTISPGGVAWDGTNYWVSHTGNTFIGKFDSDFVAIGGLISIGITPAGICWDGTNFWIVVSSTGTVHQFDSSMVSTGVTFSTSGHGANNKGITWDGTHFWVTDETSDTIYKYLPGGTFVSDHSVSAQGQDPYGITYDGERLWVVFDTGNVMVEYIPNDTMDYTGLSVSFSAQEASEAAGIEFNGNQYILIGRTSDTFYKYTPLRVVGMVSAKTDTDTDLPIYTRIK